VRKIPKAAYPTPAELDQRIKEREAEAPMLPPGTAQQSVLVEISQLRAYAPVKRLLDLPASDSQGQVLS
jgi:hypothetical protein